MTETTSTLSLGEKLKSTRESLNLTIEDVVKHTNLKKNHLEALEQDIFILPNVPPAFVRGYVGGYLRFLRLPEELANSVNYGEVTIPKQVAKVASMPVKNSQKSQHRWVKNLTWLILLGAIGMTLTWWWQEHKKDQLSNQHLVSTQAETPSPTNTSPVMEQTEANTVSEPVATVEAANTSVAPNTATEASPLENSVAVVSAPASLETLEATTSPVALGSESVVAEAVNVLKQTAEVASSTKAEETDENQKVVGEAELRIEITNAQSWITVRGEKNKKLAEKLYNSGDVLTFSGNEQYRLTVGAPANVKIYYKGQQVPLKVDGRVARFKLPLAN